MSTLAFDKQGKPFTFARSTRRLLVRFFPNPGGRGTCVAVLDGNGEQVYVDADTDYLEFRKAVRNEPGLYRLDQCDEDDNEIDGAPAAYVSIGSPRNAAGASDEVNALTIVRDLASINAEVSKTIADRFATVMEKTASILDSAAGAGILDRRLAALAALDARAPRVKHDEDAQEEDDDESDEEDAPTPDPWAPFAPIFKMVEPMLPQLGALLYTKIKELVGKNATPAPAAAPTPATATVPTPAPAAAPSLRTEPVGTAAGPDATTQAQSPSPSSVQASPSSAERTASVNSTESTPPPSPPVSPPLITATDVGAPLTAPAAPKPAVPKPDSAPTSIAVPALTDPPPDAVRNSPPMPTPEQWTHLYMIRARLSPKEAAVAENAITRMSPDMLAGWLAELSTLSVDDAVRAIRSMIAQLRPPRAPDQE